MKTELAVLNENSASRKYTTNGARLTSSQQRVYEYIRGYIQLQKHSPYIREIQSGCGITSYKVTFDRLMALEKKGLIKRSPHKHRGIVLTSA